MILAAGVGYADLGDLSFGPTVVDRAGALEWPPTVHWEDLSYNPIAAVEWFRDQSGRFERAVFVGAALRGREPGSVTSVRWIDGPRSTEVVQGCVAEAVTGSISLENLLVIAGHFGVLPGEVISVELEPFAAEPMTALSDVAEARLLEVLDLVRGQADAAVTAGNGHVAGAELVR